MHLRVRTILILFLAVTIGSLGCSKAGSEYLGKLQNVKNKNDQFDIVRNGDNFLVTKINASSGRPGTTLTCVLKDGVLQSTGGFGRATLTYVKATDRLTTPGIFGGNIEYERLN